MNQARQCESMKLHCIYAYLLEGNWAHIKYCIHCPQELNL